MYTEREKAYRDRILSKLADLRTNLNDASLAPNGSPTEWYLHLSRIKAILGNSNNDMSFVATLMAKAYLVDLFGEIDFDAAEKAQGAPGLDVDVSIAGKRVVGEIKTTMPYNGPDFGAQQKAMFEKDFAKLAAADADYKFMFVTEAATFKILCRPSFRAKLSGATIVDLTAGAEMKA